MKKINTNYSRVGNILSALGALITILSIIIFIIDGTNKDHNISELNNENMKLSEILKSDSLNRTKVEQFIKKYTIAINDHNLEINSFKSYFTDTVSRFFLEENISSKEAYYKMKWYWKKYPESFVEFDLQTMTFEKIENGFIIYLPLKNKKTGKDSIDILSEIRINCESKIYYIRDFYTNNNQ